MPDTVKVKLSGGPEKTATWIWLEKGQLKVDFYDFSELAQRMFGNDIAYTLTVDDMEKLYSLVRQEEEFLIAWLQQKYKSYFEIKNFLEENGIGFHKEIESWA